jgi:tetratricopeptide (TPR) repeat protein
MLVDFVSPGAMLLTASVLLMALAATNGTADPVHQAILALQAGNTDERREAVDILLRAGDQRAVPPLARALHDQDYLVREAAEQGLWSLWHRSGNPEVDARLQEGILEMQRGAFPRAIAVFTEVIGMAPDFAEGYNKRATTYYLMQEYEQSIRDCEATITRNPVHFGALSGAGLNYLGLRDFRKALEYFERAVQVNPNMPQIRQYIEEIKKFLRGQSL